MSNESGRLRSISWRDFCPWLMLARVFGVATSAQTLILACASLHLTAAGWQASELFLTKDDLNTVTVVETEDRDQALADRMQAQRAWPAEQYVLSGPPFSTPVQETCRAGAKGIVSIGDRLVGPLAHLVMHPVSITQAAYLVAGTLWTLLVWSLFGGAIARIAVLRLGPGDRIGIVSAVRFALRKFTAFFTAPLFPLLGAMAIASPIVALGGIMRWDLGAAFGGIVWGLVLLVSVVTATLSLGLLFAWPLMWGATAAENRDSFESISRTYACTFQRPLHYAFYVAVALLLGAIGWVLVVFFTDLVISLAEVPARLGASAERWSVITAPAAADSSAVHVGGVAHRVWTGLAGSLAVSFQFSYFFSAASGIYLLLRYDLYHRELDEVELDAPPAPVASSTEPPVSGQPMSEQPAASENPSSDATTDDSTSIESTSSDAPDSPPPESSQPDGESN